MGSSKQTLLAKSLTAVGIFIPAIAAAILFYAEQTTAPLGITMYGPYSSVGSAEQGAPQTPLGFFVVLCLANWVISRGFASYRSGRPRARVALTFGLLTPLLIELTVVIQSLVLSSSNGNMPRRYHYYYFAPEPSRIQAIWSFFVPNSMLAIIIHVTSLVLLILGNLVRPYDQTEPTYPA